MEGPRHDPAKATLMRVLLTSFEPFDGRSANSSLEVGRAVAEQPLPDVELTWLTLPVVAGACVERAWEWVERLKPALVLALGQAAGTAALQIEEQAVNLHDFAIPDNAGWQPRHQPILVDGPASYPTTLAIPPILAELHRRHLPAEQSRSAGTYVCNHFLYGLLHRAAQSRRTHLTGFLHLPLLPEQLRPEEKLPALPRQQLAEAVRVAITVSLALDRWST
jgi:pyroglutamyl-peptidase